MGRRVEFTCDKCEKVIEVCDRPEIGVVAGWQTVYACSEPCASALLLECAIPLVLCVHAGKP